MAIVEMKEFRVMQQNGENSITVCANAKQAIATLDTVENPVTQLVRTRTAIQVNVPDATVDVNFRTVIAGNGAELAGCRATPSNYEVPDGSSVIFEAYAAEGFNFMGWFIGEDTSGTPQSTLPIASIAINSTLGVSQDVVITALFAPVG
jgi:hypothetical protein